MPTLFVYISIGLDRDPTQIARQVSDETALQRLTQQREGATRILTSWALANSGETLDTTQTIRIKVPAEKLKEFPALREQFAGAMGVPVSVGVAQKINEADAALAFAQKHGGDRIQLFSKDCLTEPVQKSENPLHNTLEGFLGALKLHPKGSPARGKFITAHMNHPPFLQALKVHPQGAAVHAQLTTYLNSPANSGFVPGKTQAVAKAEPQQTPEAAVSSSDEQPQSPPPQPEPQPLEGDPHEALGRIADQHASEDARTGQVKEQAQAQTQQAGDLKSRVVSVLKVFHERSQELESIKEQDPELYKGLTTMVQALTELAREKLLSKSEDLEKDLMPGGKGDDRPPSDFDPEQFELGVKTEMKEHGLDEARAKEIVADHLSENINYYRNEKAALDPGQTGRHDLMLPAGSTVAPGASGGQNDGRVKVLDPTTGKTSWHHVRAGMYPQTPRGEAEGITAQGETKEGHGPTPGPSTTNLPRGRGA